jgi:hypothetical protein
VAVTGARVHREEIAVHVDAQLMALTEHIWQTNLTHPGSTIVSLLEGFRATVAADQSSPRSYSLSPQSSTKTGNRCVVRQRVCVAAQRVQPWGRHGHRHTRPDLVRAVSAGGGVQARAAPRVPCQVQSCWNGCATQVSETISRAIWRHTDLKASTS